MFNLETDYAIRIVQCLAAENKRLDARAIAEKTGVTPKFTLKILHGLRNGGIVKSFKGKSGGYILAKPANEITLLEVVEQVFGNLKISRCQGGTSCTHPDGICRFKGVFDDIGNYMTKKLSEVTFG